MKQKELTSQANLLTNQRQALRTDRRQIMQSESILRAGLSNVVKLGGMLENITKNLTVMDNRLHEEFGMLRLNQSQAADIWKNALQVR